MGLDLLWEITLGSWVTAALILLARLLFGRWLTARGKYLLWLPLLLRLILPFTPPSPTSLMNLLPEMPEEGAGLPAILAWIWLGGALLVLIFHAVMYAAAARELRHLPTCTDPETRSELLRLRQLTGVDGSLRMAWGSAGMLGGLFRPVLVLPVDLRQETAAPIMLHELMHQRSRHLWLGLLVRLLTAVFWFNPAVWLWACTARQDGEELCDQLVLDTGLVSPREYSALLVSEGLMSGYLTPLPHTSFGGRRGSLCRRIGLIARRKDRKGIRFLSMFLLLCIMFLGVTAPLGKTSAANAGPALPGFESLDDYLQGLQPSLGLFGHTYREQVEAGYIAEGEGRWLWQEGPTSRYSLRREIYGAERELQYQFTRSLLDETGNGPKLLTAILVCVTPEEVRDDRLSELGNAVLEDWSGLCAANRYDGCYAAVCTTEESVGESLCRQAMLGAAALGWVTEPGEYLKSFSQQPVAVLYYTQLPENGSAWCLYGSGLALYEAAWN